MTTSLVLVHGAFHGVWCWERVAPLCEAAGIPTVCVELHRGSRQADIEALQEEVDHLVEEGSRVVALGHSLGCLAISELAAASVDHLVFLAGPALGGGAPDASSAMDPLFFEAVEQRDDGSMAVSLDHTRALFYHDCSDVDIEWANSKLRPNVNYDVGTLSDDPLWQQVPSTYLVCEQDGVLRPEYQRLVAAMMPAQVFLPTSHSPMLSRPELLAEKLQRVVSAV
ncbi:alpha/beta fold hydrolase [Myxococcota bacterium]|nr:alpha/beta fold hydrolase [Myxococcota bacterium]